MKTPKIESKFSINKNFSTENGKNIANQFIDYLFNNEPPDNWDECFTAILLALSIKLDKAIKMEGSCIIRAEILSKIKDIDKNSRTRAIIQQFNNKGCPIPLKRNCAISVN